MKEVETQKLLRKIKKQRWWRFCFPKNLFVKYRTVSLEFDQGVFYMDFLYKKRRFQISIGCRESEEIDYHFTVKAFFRAYKRLKYKVRRGLEKPTLEWN